MDGPLPRRVESEWGTLSDAELVQRCAERNSGAIRHVVTSNNQRLFRTAWSILGNKADAEDAVQAGYLLAFAKIQSFEGRSSLRTWLTRIVVNEALGRRRAERKRQVQLEQEGVAVIDAYREKLMGGSRPEAADVALGREQIRRLLEDAIAGLPQQFRIVFVLREVEGISSGSVAEILAVPEATVKTRLFRARRQLRKSLEPDMANALVGTFPFAGADCVKLTESVLRRLGCRT